MWEKKQVLNVFPLLFTKTFSGATTLNNPSDNNQTVTFEAEELKMNISVISSPPPSRFSLLVSHNKTANFASLSSEHYSVKYIKSTDDSMIGTIELTVATSEVMEGQQISFFSFIADNGIIGKTNFEYLFTVKRSEYFKTGKKQLCN